MFSGARIIINIALQLMVKRQIKNSAKSGLFVIFTSMK
jgi:hypothetical protein